MVCSVNGRKEWERWIGLNVEWGLEKLVSFRLDLNCAFMRAVTFSLCGTSRLYFILVTSSLDCCLNYYIPMSSPYSEGVSKHIWLDTCCGIRERSSVAVVIGLLS